MSRWMVAAAAALALFGVAGATQTATNSVAVANQSPMADGGVAHVTFLGGSVFTPRGKANVEAGIHEFVVDVAQPRFGDALEIHIFLLNPLELPDSLRSPGNAIRVSVWHPDPAGTHRLEDGTYVTQDPDPAASGLITESSGNILLLPSLAGKTQMHVLASVTSTSGRVASQNDLELVRFGIEVRV